MAFVICERIWRHWHDMLRTWREKAMTKAEFHTIAEKIQQIRGLQALRTANEGERKLFSQIWNELHDKYHPSRADKVEVLFPNDFNDKNVPQNIKP
ncbi:hypothetical protein WUBG_16441 [Wuchereria bancrofti]|nr:hypothetical protein WUBG_16441 [Wuchereria bancrofti]